MIKRNAGIDLLRCILVYGIVVYHAFFMGGFASGYESRLWTWCVPGFAFISGYYGVRLRVSKVIRLWVMASLCFVLPICLGGRFFDLLSLNWYLHAYTILLLLSPTSIAFVLALFKAFERLNLDERVSRLLAILASSGFPVYVLHANWQVLPYLHDMSRHLILDCGIPRWPGLMLSATIAWAGCVGLFLFGKLVLLPFAGKYDCLLKYLDEKMEGLLK